MTPASGSTNTPATQSRLQAKREELERRRKEQERQRKEEEEALAKEAEELVKEEEREKLRMEQERKAEEERQRKLEEERLRKEAAAKVKQEKEKAAKKEQGIGRTKQRAKGKGPQVYPMDDDTDGEVQIVDPPSKKRARHQSTDSVSFVGQTSPKAGSSNTVEPEKKKRKMGGKRICTNCAESQLPCIGTQGARQVKLVAPLTLRLIPTRGFACQRCTARKIKCIMIESSETAAAATGHMAGDGDRLVRLLESILEQSEQTNALLEAVLREGLLTSMSVTDLAANVDVELHRRHQREVNAIGEGLWVDDSGDYSDSERDDVSEATGSVSDAGLDIDIPQNGCVRDVGFEELTAYIGEKRAAGIMGEYDYSGIIMENRFRRFNARRVAAWTAEERAQVVTRQAAYMVQRPEIILQDLVSSVGEEDQDELEELNGKEVNEENDDDKTTEE